MVNFTEILAPKFDDTKIYGAGKYVIYDNKFYISLQATGPGNFVQSHWMEVWLVDILGQNPVIVTGKAYAFPLVSGSRTYDVSKYVPDGVTPTFFVGILKGDGTQLSAYTEVEAGSDYEVGSNSSTATSGSYSYNANNKTVTQTNMGSGSNSGHEDNDQRPYDWEERWEVKERLFMVIDEAAN